MIYQRKGRPNFKNRGENNGMWKGDQVKYGSLHDYVKSYFPKSELCQSCSNKPPYDLTNISGEYKRDLSDWEWLCRSCHMIKDGRMENFKPKRILKDKICPTCEKIFRPSKAIVRFCSRKCRPVSNWKGGISLDHKKYLRERYAMRR